MSIEAWVAIISCFITVGVIIYQAGRLSSKLDTLLTRFSIHEQEDEAIFKDIYARVNSHGEKIVALETKSSFRR